MSSASQKIRATRLMAAVVVAAMSFGAASVMAADEPTFTLNIRDHHFDPAQIEVPVGVKFKLVVHNNDAAPEEFDSHELRREKVIPANGEATVNIGPLKAGTYNFAGEYHEDTAKGQLIAK